MSKNTLTASQLRKKCRWPSWLTFLPISQKCLRPCCWLLLLLEVGIKCGRKFRQYFPQWQLWPLSHQTQSQKLLSVIICWVSLSAQFYCLLISHTVFTVSLKRSSHLTQTNECFEKGHTRDLYNPKPLWGIQKLFPSWRLQGICCGMFCLDGEVVLIHSKHEN